MSRSEERTRRACRAREHRFPAHPSQEGNVIMQTPRRRHHRPLVVPAVLLLLLGCGSSPEATNHRTAPPDTPQKRSPLGWTTPAEPVACLPLTSHCLGPMPSNLLTRPDPSTPTGLRVHLTEQNFSEGVFAYAARFLDPALLNLADGFSPTGEIVIPLPCEVARQDLPQDLESSVRPDSAVLVIDTSTGERVPFHVRLDPRGLQNEPPQFFLILIPGRPLRLATPHIVVLRRALRSADGSPVPLAPGFERFLSEEPDGDPNLARLQPLFEKLFLFLEQRLEIRRQDLLLAFDFTTRSEESISSPMLHLRDETLRWTRENPPEATERTVRQGIVYPSEACEVSGTFLTPSFRTPDTKRVVFDPDGLPLLQGKEAVDFLLLLPRVPAGTRAPVVIFGHGLWVFKETVLQIAEDLLGAGFAVICIDAACHGSRIDTDGFIADLFHLETVQEAVSCLAQTVADELALVQLLQGDLTRLDLLPYLPGETTGDGVPDLDTERLYYVGQSMGTVIGLTFTALCPDISAGVLNVPGSGIVSIVTNGEITEPLVGRPFIPTGTSPLDAHLLYLSGQMFVDYLDPINFASHVCRDPLPGSGPAKQILLQQSQNDGFIPNWITDILARALGIPVIEPAVYRPYGVPVVDAPAPGSGVFQYDFTTVPYLAHLLLLLVPESRWQMVEYLDSCRRNGEGRIQDPFSRPPASP
jgi:pimeloyl-ACP methyl ester carboxylesterase